MMARMILLCFLLTLYLVFTSCRVPPLPRVMVDNMPGDFVSDSASPVEVQNISISFVDCPLSLAVRQICSQAHVSISYPAGVSAVVVNGIYSNTAVDSVIHSVASSAGCSVRWLADDVVLFVSDTVDDKICLCASAPFLSLEDLRTDENVSCQLVGGVLICSGSRADVKDYLATVQRLNERLIKSFGCEIVIVRCSRELYADVSADVEFTTTSLLKASNISDIVEIFANADATFNRSKQVVSSYIYLSEGQESSLDVGTVRQRELRSISSEGYTSTSGYKEFRDGLQLKISCNSLSNALYVLNCDISQSKFRETTSSSDVVPVNDTSEVKSNRCIVSDGKYSVLASLTDKQDSSGGQLFGLNRSDSDEMLIFFVKLRRVNPSAFGSSVVDIIDIDKL